MLKSLIMAAEAITEIPQRPVQHNKMSTGLMVLAAVCYSVMPLALVLSNGNESPFLFNAAWRGGIALTVAIFLVLAFPGLFLSGAVWKVILRRMFSRNFLLLTIAYFDIALFALSTKYVDILISIILMEFSPIAQLLLIWLYQRNRDTQNIANAARIRTQTALFILVGVLGVLFIILSWVGTEEFFKIIREVQIENLYLWSSSEAQVLALGVSLAVGSALIYAFNSRGQPWGESVKDELPEELVKSYGTGRFFTIDLFCATIPVCIASLVIVPFCLAIGFGVSGDTYNPEVQRTLVYVLLVAALVHPIAAVAWRQAHIITDNPGINALRQLQPLLSLAWLLLASFVGWYVWTTDVRGDYLVIGTAAIITANLLINFEAEIRWGFKALIIGLGTCGAVVYLRDGTFTFLGIGTEHWVTNDYLGAVALVATVFTLLLAFRVAHLVSRTTEEETHAFNAFRKLDMLVRKGTIAPEIRECIMIIDSPQNQTELKEAYAKARKLINERLELTNDFDRETLLAAEADLDILARSKQLGLVLGELFALIIFAGLTMAFALLLRPDVQGALTAMLYDLFAMLISAVVFFLTVHVLDLHQERAKRQLQMPEDRDDYLVAFPDTDRSMGDLWISVVSGLALVLTYAALLAHKWLNWFGG